MVVAGVLLILNNGVWAYFGLVGGGMYVYFAGRAIWALVGLITIAAAVVALPIA